uniref:CGL160/ATPI domain-containing protein n=1 Tax=Timspurckia oligopyrenoides TaxID=708627 RepID=A0A6T6N5T6_9RHOD
MVGFVLSGIGNIARRGLEFGERCNDVRLHGSSFSLNRRSFRWEISMEIDRTPSADVEVLRNESESSDLDRIEDKFGPKETRSGELDAKRREQLEILKYNQLRIQLIADTMTLGAVGMLSCYALSSLRVALSYGVGLSAGVVYVILLSRSVDKLAEAARSGSRSMDVFGAARQAVFALAILFVIKNKDELDVLPALAGLFTYKLATLSPALFGELFRDSDRVTRQNNLK